MSTTTTTTFTRPEHEHYETLEQWIKDSIRKGADFLFDADLFDQELHRIWDDLDIHPHVSVFIY